MNEQADSLQAGPAVDLAAERERIALGLGRAKALARASKRLLRLKLAKPSADPLPG